MNRYFNYLNLFCLCCIFLISQKTIICADEGETVLSDEKINKYLEYDQLGSTYYNNGDYRKSVEYFKKAIQVFDRNPLPYYNGACSAALKGWKKTAFELLEGAIDRGYLEVDHIKQDPDLDSIRTEAS